MKNEFIFVAAGYRQSEVVVDRLAACIPGLVRECLADKLSYSGPNFVLSAMPIGDGTKFRGTNATVVYIDPHRIPKECLVNGSV